MSADPTQVSDDESIYPFTEVGFCRTCGNYYMLQQPIPHPKYLKSLHKAIAISDTDPTDNANPFRTTP